MNGTYLGNSYAAYTWALILAAVVPLVIATPHDGMATTDLVPTIGSAVGGALPPNGSVSVIETPPSGTGVIL